MAPGETKPLILIAEDEASIAEVLKTALETEGFLARHADHGAATLEALRETEPALLLLDIGLPDQTGFEVLKAARTIRANLPILFLTARSGELDRVLGLELGADDYVTKPFSPREVVARVKAILRRAGGPTTSPREESPDFIIDDVRKRVTVGGKAVTLSRQEYRILLTLAARPGKVFSRDELMSRAWDEPGMSMDRAIDTHIKTLRSKLGAEWVLTHRGLGYALRDDKAVRVLKA